MIDIALDALKDISIKIKVIDDGKAVKGEIKGLWNDDFFKFPW